MTRKKRLLIFFAINFAILLSIPLFLIYREVSAHFPYIAWCGMHDIFKLYCPFCGGTRAISELLTFNIVGAFKANALIPLYAILFLFLDLRAFISIVKNEKKIFNFSTRHWFILLGISLLYFIVRNILLVGFGIDPLGDLIIHY